MVQIRDQVYYVDEHGGINKSLVTFVHQGFAEQPDVNLVYVDGHGHHDDFGAPLVRLKTVPHKVSQGGTKCYWYETR